MTTESQMRDREIEIAAAALHEEAMRRLSEWTRENMKPISTTEYQRLNFGPELP